MICATPRNAIINGDCVTILSHFPASSVDFILTDPPYIARYKSRSNETLRNDDNAEWLAPAFAEMYRVLKPHSCALSFYGWPKVDLFFRFCTRICRDYDFWLVFAFRHL